MVARALYANLNIGSVISKPTSIEPAVLEDLHQKAMEPAEALIAGKDPTAVIRDSLPDPSEEHDDEQGHGADQGGK